DFALAPDGSRVAVTDGSTIRVLDRTGREVALFANEAGIRVGGIAWGEDGIVFVDQSSGVLRVIQP
ncbi:MAG TPA: hypothetical protein VGR08_10745, partial [Thermomicrobiales bacterium]|nr:hypothetical protein [Thermomicrobiales bacterium]